MTRLPTLRRPAPPTFLLLLALTAPGTGQEPVHEIPCENGTAGGYACDRVDLLSHLSPLELGAADSILLNDVWGWTDPRTGREYALVGRMDGVAFVDVTEPHLPRYLGSLAATPGSRTTIWRDVKVFRNHAFVVAGGAGSHGMQVFDLRQFREVADPVISRPPLSTPVSMPRSTWRSTPRPGSPTF